MRVIGFFLWIVGAAVVAYALLVFDPTVSFGGSRIANLDLQHRQTMIALCGGILFLAGVALHGISFLRPTSEMIYDEGEPAHVTLIRDRFGSLPLPQADISDQEIARQEADSQAFMARQR